MTNNDMPMENADPTIYDLFDFASYTSMAALRSGRARRWMIVDKKTRKVLSDGIKSKAGAIARAKKLQGELG